MSTKRIFASILHDGGDSGVVGHLDLKGYSIVKDEYLQALRAGAGSQGAQVVALLAQCRRAMTTPQGNQTTRKARDACEAIDKFLGDVE